MHNVTLILGDGTGPEIVEAARRCIDATGVKIKWEIREAGVDVFERTGELLPEETIESIRRNKVALKGPITTPIGTGFRSINVQLRKIFDLYINLRPCRSYEGVRSKYKDIDLIVIRENTDDLYVGIEFEKGKEKTLELIKFLNENSKEKILEDSGISIKPISIFKTERIIRYAFEYAKKHNRKKITVVHKANIMKFTDGLFLEVARNVAKDYPDIEFEDRIVDNMCMQLVQKPELYDVLVLPNLYGDIISDLCAGLVGGLGVAPGANIGKDIAIFEAVHGSAPKYKGLNKVNPCALILSGVLMLRYLKEDEAANRLENAVKDIIKEGRYVTYDLKENRDDPDAVGTNEMADAIIRKISK